MPLASAYYDTCIFLVATNPAVAEHVACCALVDISRIGWVVHFSHELSAGESTAGEYIAAFFVECVRNGIAVRQVTINEAKSTAKRYRELKRAVGKVGLAGFDWIHLMCAVSAGSAAFCTVDEDYFDAANKANAGGRSRSIATKRLLEGTLAITICFPSQFLAT